MEPGVLTSKLGAIWVFPDGPNNEGQYVACTDLDAITEPLGDVELIRCFDVFGKWKTVGQKQSPPDPVTTTLTSLTFPTRTWLERIRGSYGLIFLERDGGRADLFTNWKRALILSDVRNTEKVYDNIVKRETEAEATRAFSVTADPPVIECVNVTGVRVSSSNVDGFNDVAMLTTDEGILPVKYGVAVCDGHAAVKANVYLTSDGGQTWTSTAAQPFAVAENIEACAILDMGNNIHRIIAALEAPAGAQGKIAYSDDNGATWNVVNVGGAAAGHGALGGGAIFALDDHHMWLASAAGYIYFSADAGETWTAQDAGVATAGDYFQVKFEGQGMHGYAVAETGVVVRTVDGGVSWVACTTTITATPDVISVAVIDSDTAWVGTATGGLWFTTDAGVTWTQRTGWVGSGAGKVHAVGFVNDYVGFMLSDTAAPVGRVLRTIDGGFNWTVLTSDANNGLTSMFVGDSNYIVYTGLVSSGTGFIGFLAE
jgi:photosystem II stability/assembly factor-like uncharacterized protein